MSFANVHKAFFVPDAFTGEARKLGRPPAVHLGIASFHPLAAHDPGHLLALGLSAAIVRPIAHVVLMVDAAQRLQQVLAGHADVSLLR